MRKEERDLQRAIAIDGTAGDMKEAFAAADADKAESERLFKEAGRTFFRGEATLWDCRRKPVNGEQVKLWFVYEYPDKRDVHLLTIDQHFNGEKYSFSSGEDTLIFSYA